MNQAGFDRHLTDDLLEKYSMGHVPEEQAAPLEEHLLICSECQVRLTGIDEYVHATRAASAMGGNRTRRPFFGGLLAGWLRPVSKPVWAFGLATASLTILLVVAIPRQLRPERQTELSLVASRGDPALLAHATVRDKILLKVDAATVPAAAAYRLQLVNSSGNQIWKSGVIPPGQQIVALVPHTLSSGKYWVRIYNSSDLETPLQEYGLEVR